MPARRSPSRASATGTPTTPAELASRRSPSRAPATGTPTTPAGLASRRSRSAAPAAPAAAPAASASPVLAGLLWDPTVLFTAAVVLLPVAFVPSPAAALAYLLQPNLLAAYALFAGMLLLAARGGRCAPLGAADALLARWCLCNGVFFNLFLDVVAGQFQALGAMTTQYNRVEPRYALGLAHPAGAPVFMTSMLELFFQAPLGLLAFVAIHWRAPGRHTAALALALLHAAGVWYFYVPEALSGFPNLGGWPRSRAEALSTERLLFFWFGFWFCGCLWTGVAALVAARSARAIAAAVAREDGVKAA